MADEAVAQQDVARSEDLCATCDHPRRIHGWGYADNETPCDGDGILLDLPCYCGEFVEPQAAAQS